MPVWRAGKVCRSRVIINGCYLRYWKRWFCGHWVVLESMSPCGVEVMVWIIKCCFSWVSSNSSGLWYHYYPALWLGDVSHLGRNKNERTSSHHMGTAPCLVSFCFGASLRVWLLKIKAQAAARVGRPDLSHGTPGKKSKLSSPSCNRKGTNIVVILNRKRESPFFAYAQLSCFTKTLDEILKFWLMRFWVDIAFIHLNLMARMSRAISRRWTSWQRGRTWDLRSSRDKDFKDYSMGVDVIDV